MGYKGLENEVLHIIRIIPDAVARFGFFDNGQEND